MSRVRHRKDTHATVPPPARRRLPARRLRRAGIHAGLVPIPRSYPAVHALPRRRNPGRLASSQGCRNQGFLYNGNVLGLQFHPEITPDALAGLVEHCGGELSIAGGEQGRYVQDAKALLAGLSNAGELNAMMAKACERL